MAGSVRQPFARDRANVALVKKLNRQWTPCWAFTVASTRRVTGHLVRRCPAKVELCRCCSTEALMRSEARVEDEAERKSTFQFPIAERAQDFQSEMPLEGSPKPLDDRARTRLSDGPKRCTAPRRRAQCWNPAAVNWLPWSETKCLGGPKRLTACSMSSTKSDALGLVQKTRALTGIREKTSRTTAR